MRRHYQGGLIVAISVVAGMLLPALASAAVLCVNKVGPQCDQLFTANQLNQAFQTAFSNGQATPDRIEIGPGVYAQGPYTANSAVEIIGSGMDETVLTHSAPLTNILLLANYNNPQQRISDLTLRATSRADGAYDVRALQAARGVVERVRVEVAEGAGVAGIDAFGVTLRHIEVKAGSDSHGISGGGVLEDSTIEGGSGVFWNSGVIRRVRVRALERDGITFGGSLSLENSVIEVSGPDAAALRTNAGFPEQVTVSHVTAVGGGSPGTVGVLAVKEGSLFGPTSASIEVRNSTFTGFETALRRKGYEGGGGPPCMSNCRLTQDVSVSWSQLVGSIEDEGGPGSITLGQGLIRQGQPGFLTPGGGEYRLRHNSPLVDAGEPVGLEAGAFYQNESPLTIDGQQRIANGRRDIGAFEYGRRAPSAALSLSTRRVFLYRPVKIGIEAADPDGDPLKYELNLGEAIRKGGAGGPKRNLSFAFTRPGRKTVKLTVSDPTGMAALVSESIRVVARKGRCANRRVGGKGRDRFVGSPAGDRLLGFAGNDVLLGGAGADCLLGGPGADRIVGGPGPDRVWGGPGNDRIDVRGGGRDIVDCGPGRRDRVLADFRDRLRNCELVTRR